MLVELASQNLNICGATFRLKLFDRSMLMTGVCGFFVLRPVPVVFADESWRRVDFEVYGSVGDVGADKSNLL